MKIILIHQKKNYLYEIFKDFLYIFIKMNISNYIVDCQLFRNEQEKNNFLLYCDHMMFASFDDPYPIDENDILPYFRNLYKYIEMLYYDDLQKMDTSETLQ